MKCKLYNNTSSIRSILDVLCYYTRQKKITKKSQNLKNRHLKNKNLKLSGKCWFIIKLKGKQSSLIKNKLAQNKPIRRKKIFNFLKNY